MRMIFIYLFPILLLEGCSEAKDLTEAAPIVGPAEVVYKVDWSNPEYTKFLSQAIDKHGQDMIKVLNPSDKGTYGFKATTSHQAKRFYMILISSMARFESNFKPESNFYECAETCKYKKCKQVPGRGFCMIGGDPLDGGLVISRGLLQISFGSAKSYGCPVSHPNDLNDPEKNLICGVKIMNKWVAKDKTIGTNKLGGAQYWSVLREASKSRPKIIAKTKSL